MSRIVNAVGRAIGKKPRMTRRESEFALQVYATWLGLATENGLEKVRCSRSTFMEHLNHDGLIAGPWTWEIDDKVRDGVVELLRRDKTKIGDMRVSELVIH